MVNATAVRTAGSKNNWQLRATDTSDNKSIGECWIIAEYATEEEAKRVLGWIFTQASENPVKGVDLSKLDTGMNLNMEAQDGQ